MIKSSVRNQLILLILLSIIIPMTASTSITHFYTRDALRERVKEENSKLLYQGIKNLSYYLESFNRISSNIYSNAALYQLLLHGVSDPEQDAIIHAGLQSMLHAAEGVDQVYLHVNEQNRAYLLANGSFRRGTIAAQPWTKTASPYTAWIESTHSSHNYGLSSASYREIHPVITFHRPIYQVPTTTLIGSLSIDIRLDEISALGDHLYERHKEDLTIIDDQGIVIFASNPEQIGQTLSEPWIQQLAGDEIGMLEWRDPAFSGLMIYNKLALPYMNWTLVKQIPDHHLYESTRNLTRVNLLIAFILLIAALAVSIAMSLRITNPIKQLIRHINKIQIGQLHEPIVIERQDEIGMMAKRFQAMMDTINDLFLQRYKLELANKTSQLHMLQAQINPHFINNALQSIGTLALQHQDVQVYKLIASLGQMMHYSMDTKESIVPFSYEFAHLRNYLELQKQRFGEQFEYEIDVEANLESTRIPKMILQPIVENFFKHGFPSQKNGHLRITASQNNHEQVQVVIEDNGSGMDPDRLLHLQHDLANIEDHSIIDGIGLINVMARLNLYYGKQAAMELGNVQPNGFRVTLTIPAHLEVTP